MIRKLPIVLWILNLFNEEHKYVTHFPYTTVAPKSGWKLDKHSHLSQGQYWWLLSGIQLSLLILQILRLSLKSPKSIYHINEQCYPYIEICQLIFTELKRMKGLKCSRWQPVYFSFFYPSPAPSFTWSKWTMETPEQYVKSVQS